MDGTQENIQLSQEAVNGYFNSGSSNHLTPSIVQGVISMLNLPDLYKTLESVFSPLFSQVGADYNANFLDGQDLRSPLIRQEILEAFGYTYNKFVKDAKAELENDPNLKGEKGETGRRGETGRDGADGQDGRDGQPGRDGADGQSGRDGGNNYYLNHELIKTKVIGQYHLSD
jgi:hypothetical protein